MPPNGLVFHDGKQFSVRDEYGAFVAFHGFRIRRPFGQKAFLAAFVPFQAGEPKGRWEIFASGFAGKGLVSHPSEADHRPTGLALGPEGPLYLVDDQEGYLAGALHG